MGLLPGAYRVVFTLPPGYVWTLDNTGGDTLDSDPIPASPSAATATTAAISLTSSTVADTDPAGLSVTDPTVDAGVVPLVSLGDLVWVDADGDGQFDVGTRGADLGRHRRRCSTVPATRPRNAFGITVPATTTDANGRYSFTSLVPGDYEVVFTLPTGYLWTVDNTGGDGLDSDAVAATVDAPTASTGVFTLDAAAVVDPDTSPSRRLVTDPTIDAGVVPLVSLGDLVWIDTGPRRPVRRRHRVVARRCRGGAARRRRQPDDRCVRQPAVHRHRRGRPLLVRRSRAGHLPGAVHAAHWLRLDHPQHRR